jgi:hypothetical protein
MPGKLMQIGVNFMQVDENENQFTALILDSCNQVIIYQLTINVICPIEQKVHCVTA